jgi:protein-S-isoprenylcysteine O-methyltransferase Ste14
MLDAQHIIPVLTLVLCIIWLIAEVWSLPKSRKQLDIPRGDWLTVALGAVPVVGTAEMALWQYFFSTGKVYSVLVVSGLTLCLAGIMLRTWSKIVLGRFYTFAIGLSENHRVLVEGPYRFVRHPLYLGTFLIVIGFLLLTQSWSTLWFLTLPTVLVYSLRLVKEDAYLIQELGSEYQSYASRTARLVPFIW